MDGVARARGVRFVVRVSLALAALGAGGCACTVLDDSGDESEGGCFIGEECPDGSCALGIPIPAEYPCCGFGGECAPASGTHSTMGTSETTDDASTSESSTTDATTGTTETTSTTDDTTTSTSDATTTDATTTDATTSGTT